MPAPPFDVAPGTIRWTAELGEGEVRTPAVTGGVVYVARGPLDLSEPHEVVALDAADGSVGWRWSGLTVERLFLAAVADGAVFVGSEDHNVYRLGAATGTGDLFFETEGSVDRLAAIADGTLYVSRADRPSTRSIRCRRSRSGSSKSIERRRCRS